MGLVLEILHMKCVNDAMKNMHRCIAYITLENSFRIILLLHLNCQESTKKYVQMQLNTLYVTIVLKILYMAVVKDALKNMHRCTASVTHKNSIRNLADGNCLAFTEKYSKMHRIRYT